MAAQVNVASNLRTAIDIVRVNLIVRELGEELKKPGVAGDILSRVFRLTKQATDVRYENPNDTALMIYTWLLKQYSLHFALMASAAICRVPNLWWASNVATQLIDQRIGLNEMAGEVSEPVPANSDAGDRVFVLDTSFFFPSHFYLASSKSSSSLERSNVLTADIFGDPTVLNISEKSDSIEQLESIAA
jgi:hypothetical protein